MASYDYTKVPIDSSKNEIRLLLLQPYDPSCTLDFVSCNLVSTCLDSLERPKFSTVSYTWDNPFQTPQMTVPEALDCPRLPPSTIILDGVAVLVTGNLESFLRHTRSNTTKELEQMIWVDALCINQSDTEEKSRQIQLMRRIYAGAEHVTVWLGPNDRDTDVAISFLNEIGALGVSLGMLSYREADLGDLMAPAKTSESAQSAEIRATVRHLQTQLGCDKFPIVAIKALYDRWWWYRTWVLQEICLAKTADFVCGTKRISFDHFVGAHMFAATYMMSIVGSLDPQELWQNKSLWGSVKKFLNTSIDPRPGHVIGMRRRYQNRAANLGNAPHGLIQVLIRAHVRSSSKADLGATNPRDRVYGLLGLAEDAHELGLNIDYGATVEHVYIDVAYKLLRKGHVDVLALAQADTKKLNLPTWVPDWSGQILEPCGESVLDGFFRACGDTTASVVSYEKRFDESHVLGIEGLKVCEIGQVGAQWRPVLQDWKFDWDEFQKLLMDVERFCADSPRIPANNLEEAVVRTICFDQERVVWRRRTGALDGSAMFTGFKKNAVGKREALTHYVGDADFSSFQITMGELFSRRPFLSTDGYVGLAPASAQKGDVICIFKGAIVPFTLRRHSDELYEVIGETYVYQGMDGELLPERAEFEVFHLV